MNITIRIIIFTIFIGCGFFRLSAFANPDTIASGFSRPLQWRIGIEAVPGWVPGTNVFLKGLNPEEKRIDSYFAGDIRADFSFAPYTRESRLYKGLYQGIGLGTDSFFSNRLLGTPLSAYVYQGAPVARLSPRLRIVYEWQFGAAFGWKHFDSETADYNGVASTSVTAHMGLGFKFHYMLSARWNLTAGIIARHFSNGNTSWPNAGANTIGASVGLAYSLTPQADGMSSADNSALDNADKGRWFYDIMAYGAWRKRVIYIGEPTEPHVCYGTFGVAGLQISPMRRLDRWFSVGPSLDLQWDESASLAEYRVADTPPDVVRFWRPPFRRQLSVGMSAHVELTAAIFSIDVGLGYELLCPKGDKAFYQSLSLKTFLTRNLYINTGYRLGNFSDPQNLMLGLGVRL